jgi:hypothetical protein
MPKRKKAWGCLLMGVIWTMFLTSKDHSLALIDSLIMSDSSSSLLINEYLADPPDGPAGDANGDGTRNSADDEFIELVNDGTLPLSIGGYTISDADRVRFTIPSGKVIPPGEAAVIFGGGQPTGAFGNTAANGLIFTAALSLNNTGDSIVVKDSSGALVASVQFGSAEGNGNQSITRTPDIIGTFGPHSAAPGTIGLFSPGTRLSGEPFTEPLPVISSIVPDEVEAGTGPLTLTINGNNFETGVEARIGSQTLSTIFVSSNQLTAHVPGVITSVVGDYALIVANPGERISNSIVFVVRAPRLLSQIGINEYLADPPDGAIGDANGDGRRDSAEDEFVEIVNRTQIPLDIGDFTLSDASQVRFRFPPNTTIPAGEAAVVFGGGSPTGDFGNARLNGLVFLANLSLNNGGDSLTIKDPTGNVIETIAFGPVEGGANQSLNRDPDLVGFDFIRHSTIADSSGAVFSPGSRSSGEPFTNGPRITAISPDMGRVGDPPFTVQIVGSGFGAGSVGLIDSLPVETSVLSGTEMSVVVPSSVTSVAGSHQILVRNSGGGRSNFLLLTIVRPPPALRSIRPKVVSAGSGSFGLFAVGSGFDSPAVLVDEELIQANLIGSGELFATVPAHLVETEGSRRVRIRNLDGKQSNELTFEVISPGSRIDSLSPSHAGVATSDFTLSVSGLNFSDTSVVWFGDSPLNTTFVSSNALSGLVPASALADPRLVSVTVRSSLGVSSNEVVFRIDPIVPAVASVTPGSTVEGAEETLIEILGDSFQPGAAVRAQGKGFSLIRLQTEFINPQRLRSRLPAELLKAPGRLTMTVENPDFGVSAEIRFDIFIRDALVLNEYLADPPPGLAGDANGDGNRSSSQDEFIEIVNRTSDPLDVSGFRLLDSDAVRHIFSGETIIPAYEALVVFGGGRPMGAFGNTAENRLLFTASSGGLSLNNGGDTIRLEDRSGRLIQEIIFGSNEGTAQQSINRDPDADGADFVEHKVASLGRHLLFSPGSRVDGRPFTDKPSVASLSPSDARVGSRTFELRVFGSNFVEGAQVQFGEKVLETAYIADNELRANVLEEFLVDGGLVNVVVRNPRGEMSSPTRFTVVDDPPHISSITPEKTSTGAENLQITVIGNRFQPGCGVVIGGVTIEASLVSGASSTVTLRIILPSEYFLTARQLELRVRNADGNLSNGVFLKIENGPLLTKLQRTKIKVGSGTIQLRIGGIAFSPSMALFVDEVSVPTQFISDTELVVTIAGELTMSPRKLTLQLRSQDGGRSNKANLKIVE